MITSDAATASPTDAATAALFCQRTTLHRRPVPVAPYVLLYLESLDGAEQSQTEHLALLDACRDGNADVAIALLESHLADASTAVIDFLGATQ